MAKCIANLSGFGGNGTSTPFNANFDFVLDTAQANTAVVQFNDTDSLKRIMSFAKSAIEARALAVFGVILADSDIRIMGLPFWNLPDSF